MIQIHIICKMSDDGEMVEIPNFERYVISRSGIIASLSSGRIMKQAVIVHPGGYKHVTVTLLKDDGKRYGCIVSRLVAKAFIPNPDNLPTVDHIDRNSQNNNVSNLRWASRHTQVMNRDFPIGMSGHRNIVKNGNSWMVQIRRHKKLVFSKTFQTIEAAIQARDVFLSTEESSST